MPFEAPGNRGEYHRLAEPEDRSFPELYKEVFASMKPRQVVIVALPDPLHLNNLKAQEVEPNQIAAVIPKSYHGVGPNFLPFEYTQKSQEFCKRSRRMREILLPGLRKIQKDHPNILGFVTGRGLVAGIQVVHPGDKEPDAQTAMRINERCFQKAC